MYSMADCNVFVKRPSVPDAFHVSCYDVCHLTGTADLLDWYDFNSSLHELISQFITKAVKQYRFFHNLEINCLNLLKRMYLQFNKYTVIFKNKLC